MRRFEFLIRGVAFAAASLLTANALGEWWTRFLQTHPTQRFDASGWWMDFGRNTPWVQWSATVVVALVLASFALRPRMSRARRVVTLVAMAGVIGSALVSTARYYTLSAGGEIVARSPLPFTALVLLGALAIAALTVRPPHRPIATIRWWAWPIASFLFAVAFAVAQFACFGTTDYRRPADAIVVFGCLAHADGTPSDALYTRVKTGIELYHEGYAERLVLSGGPTAGDHDETDVMRSIAVAAGVPENAIIHDRFGWSTAATVRNSRLLFAEHGVEKALVVSQFYHLPRIKLAYQRAGIKVATVPASGGRLQRHDVKATMREIVAFWAYFVAPVVR